MGLVGSIVGSGMSILGSIGGGIAQAIAMRKVKKSLNNQKKENQNWYDRRYNEDATQRADAQRLITMTEESIKNRNKQATGAAAVMGGTQESVAAAKAANNGVLADTMSQIAVNAEQRKDAIEEQYLERKDNIEQKLNDMQTQKAQNISQAIQGVAGAAGDIAGLF